MVVFNPPLCETTILNIPFHPGRLTFTATAEVGQLDTVQIWSDIPDNSPPPDGRERQGWSARSFKSHNNASVASLSIPFHDFLHPARSQFSFTYRILHPDGSIEWLGDYGKNGSLIVNRYDDRFVLFGDWASSSLGHVFTPKSAIKSLQVFSLWDKIKWYCWDLSDGAPRLLSSRDGPTRVHSALFIPSQPKAAIIPLSPVLLTSQDVQATVNLNARSAHITSPAKGGQLSLQTLSPEALFVSLTAALPSVVSIPDPDNRYACFLLYPDRTLAHLVLVPLSPDSSPSVPSTFSIPLSPILSHVQSLSNPSSSFFSISNPTRFVSTSTERVQLDIPHAGGGRFSLAPVYDLVKPDGDLRLSLLSQHNRVASPINHDLFTPPPSPPLGATEAETQQDNHQLPDQLPAVHVHHIHDQTTEPALASGQSTPNPGIQPQLASGQTTPKPRPAPSALRPIERTKLMKLVLFVLRILVLCTRIMSRIILSILSRLSAFKALKREPVATPKIKTIDLRDDSQTEAKPTSLSSAVHTPVLLTPRAGTPRRQHSGASTPILPNDTANSVGQDPPGVSETLEAVTTKIAPEFAAKIGEEERPQEDLGGSYAHEPKPDPDFRNEQSGHNEKWELIHRPGISFELAPLPEGEAVQKIRLILNGAESAAKTIKVHLNDIELTDVKVEPLASAGQDGLWNVEVPRMTSALSTLRVF